MALDQSNQMKENSKEYKDAPDVIDNYENILENVKRAALIWSGFYFGGLTRHSSRNMSFDDLELLLAEAGRPETSKSEYRDEVIERNVLGKRTLATRRYLYRHLQGLYGLDPNIVLFRSMLHFWNRDVEGRPLLAFLCAYARDPALRLMTGRVLPLSPGEGFDQEAVQRILNASEFGRFNPGTLAFTAKNVSHSLARAGLLIGCYDKKRSKPVATAGSLSYALLLGYLGGERGKSLFETEYVKLMDLPFHEAVNLAMEASWKGWIVFKMIGDVIEVLFPEHVSADEIGKMTSIV